MSVRRLAVEQPEAFAFTFKNLDWARGQIKKYPKGREASAVLPLMWRAQEQCGGWLPEPALRYVADMLDMAYIRVYEIATFYTMFQLKPKGKYLLQVCTTTPCWLRGSDAIMKACEHAADGETFSVQEVECLGACVNAPVVQVNDDFYEDLDEASLKKVLDAFKRGETPKSGPQVDRQTSAPEGGPTTLMPATLRSE
jgi:NADH-quinone oxidoreductase subunit E